MGVLVKNGKSYTGTGDLLIQPVIYSDDERCIGVWRDGKPLYQKTISFDDTMFQNDGSGKKITVTIPDVEAIKTSQVFIENNIMPLTYAQGSIYATYWAIVNNPNTVDIVFRYSSEIGSNLHGFFINSTAILQYTKTTDTAGTAAWVPTGATPVHYSLNEQVIGTWIDGKPLYQRTLEFQDFSISTSQVKNLITLTDITVMSVDSLIIENGNQFPLPEKTTRICHRATGVLEISAEGNWRGTLYITLQYTKTTD